jgi:hypothetical protein
MLLLASMLLLPSYCYYCSFPPVAGVFEVSGGPVVAVALLLQ